MGQLSAYKAGNKTSGWILAVEIQKENDEQQWINAEHAWIAKYRAAVKEIPPKQTLLAKIRAALETAWRAAIHISHTVTKQRSKAQSHSEAHPSRLQLEKPAEHKLERKPTIKARARNSMSQNRRRRRVSQ